MPTTAKSSTAEEMVDDEESLEEMRTVAESQASEFEGDFMQRMGYDVSSLLEKACPAFVKNPNTSYGPKCTSTPDHTIEFEQDWSLSSISDSEERYKQGMYLENCSFVEETNHRDFTTCTWETLESTRTKSSKPTSISFASGLGYSNVELCPSTKKSMHSLSAVDPTPTETMVEEQTCNKSMKNDESNTVVKTPINQQEPVVTTFPNLFVLNLQPCVRLERLKSEELNKYMHPKKSQSELKDVQLELHTDANSDEQAKEITQKSTHTSRNDVSEIQVPPKEKDFTLVTESISVSVDKKSIEDPSQQKFVQSIGNIDFSVSATNNSPVRTLTTGTKQQPHRRIFTSSDFLTPLQKKIPQEKNTDSNLSTPTMNCCPIKKRKVSSTKENITKNEITEQFNGKTISVQLTTPSSNEVEMKTSVVPKNKKQLVFPKQLKMLECKIKMQSCTDNDSVDPYKKAIIAKIYKPRMTQPPSSDAIKPKKAATIGRSHVGASPSAAESKMDVNVNQNIPITIENAAGLNIPQNVKQKQNKSSIIGRNQESAYPSAVETEMDVTVNQDIPMTIENATGLNIPQNVKPKQNKSSIIGRNQESASSSAVETKMDVNVNQNIPITIENAAGLNIPQNVKPKQNKSSIIGRNQEGAIQVPPSAIETEMDVTVNKDIPMTIENATGLNIPQNVKPKKKKSTTTLSAQSQVVETDILAKYLGTVCLEQNSIKNKKPS
ncbi:hypothetical protein B566_EDAN016615 [Ephemera danica]|nr:hypothetical protein B566_EDAN016615 [Ephemera danica]